MEVADAKRKETSRLNNLFGICMAIMSGILFASYMQRLHETRLWFSNLRLVEQEISLRTECGLYYSYYKWMVGDYNESFLETINRLFIHDITTEYPREINILERFNIYQEILLAQLYKLMKYCCEVFGIDSDSVTPMLFYVYAHFAMAGFGVWALFLCVWRLYDSWLYGLLVFAWMCTNLEDSTRVFFSVNLRENFSLPLFWLQNLFIISILDDFGNNDNNNNDNINNNGSNSNVKLLSPRRSTYRYMIVAFMIATFLFALFWQFNQFLLLIQSSSLFVTAVLKWKSSNRAISQILIAQSFALFCVAIAQFAQPMALFSVSTQFNAAVLITFALSRFFHQFKSAIGMVFVKTLVAFLFCVLINFCVNNGLNTSNSDSHIWTFVKAKLGMRTQSSPVPFETALYLCHGAFKFIEWSFFVRSAQNGCLLLYLMSMSIIIVSIIYCVFMKQERHWDSDIIASDRILTAPIIYLGAQSVQLAIIAIFALRMKYVWYPQMIIVAVWTLFNTSHWLTPKCGKILAVAIALALLYRHYDVYKEQMSDEREFYDPDTVDLMEWIIKSTPTHSSWAGSMQLMAGVKACTNRYLINHPHFEDAWIRNRTQRVYQIYGRKSVEEVHGILVNESVDYIVIEESICFADSNGCSTNDIVDLSNGHLIDSTHHTLNSLYASELNVPGEARFCVSIRDASLETMRRQSFKLVFINPTFRVYQIL